MTKRERAMSLIAAEVANAGSITKHAIRLYVESRMSYASFQEVLVRGKKVADVARARGRQI